ncbi:MAG: hypothetical protein EXR67_02875 [Dehalococcoidia bacterium]|nr:hypothetical protein [Dehalococcoidia bacterium]
MPAKKMAQAAAKTPVKPAARKKAVVVPAGAVALVAAGDKAVSAAQLFGALGLKVGNKAFAMLYKGSLVVKLPAARVQALTNSRTGEPFDPGMGRPMKEWIAIGPQQEAQWVNLSKEARDFVAKTL